MKDLTKLLSLPATLLALTLTTCSNAEGHQWPYNLPRSVKYFPEDEHHVKRNLEVQQRMAQQTPVGVKKMGHDPGEKFYLEYWEFGEQLVAGDGSIDTQEHVMRRPAVYESLGEYANETDICMLLAPYSPHTDRERIGSPILGRNILLRDFKCPSGTNSCSNVGSSLCCPSGETCVDTSNGVGCCPSGQTCGNTLAGCDTAAGYSSCPSSESGGCCLPGAQCFQTGCEFYGTSTTTTTLPTVTVTSGSPSRTSTSSASTTSTTSATSTEQGTTVIVGQGGHTTTVVVTQQGSTVTTTVVSPTTIVISPVSSATECSSGFSSCASSLEGGCCRNGQICGTSTSCVDASTSSTVTAAPPVRPTTSASDTSVSVADTSTTSDPTTSSAMSGCPNGYYMCSAVYLGGCCQVDRDCHSTSCPASATTDIVTSGLTIAAGATGSACATGWMSCAADVGGGCCPSGYVCNTASCSNTAGGGTQAKQTASSAAVVFQFAWSLVALAAIAAGGMIGL